MITPNHLRNGCVLVQNYSMKIILLNILIVLGFYSQAQYYTQYFDGADTINFSSVMYEIDASDTSNVWQVGPPQKQIFDLAASVPNVLITDTVNHYPNNDTSIVEFRVSDIWSQWGIFALQWMQKIDLDSLSNDGGLVHFSNDGGATWLNALNNPYVYNYFGFDLANINSIQGQEEGFVGTDTNWRNVWLCLDLSWLQQVEDTLLFRFTFVSDSANNDHEGWMIDNMMANITGVHTVNEIEQSTYLKIEPNPVADKLYIQAKKVDEFHIIEDLLLYNSAGELVREFHSCPTKFWIDVRNLESGNYYLSVKTNLQSERHQVIIQH